MSTLFAWISAAFAVLAFIAVAMMLYAAATVSGSAGMAIIAFQLWALIAGCAAVVLGIVARLLGRETLKGLGAANFGIGLGLGSLLAMFIIVFIFG
ncbi:hypothetical protein ACJ3XI_03285 [Litorimonas sp. RW-G-Af-16]|uniref:hypothetical protein n=1 Tax=Litorimonas sp. RW-G-Af-16 TaxID=3241168 RepID=UPI00390CA568